MKTSTVIELGIGAAMFFLNKKSSASSAGNLSGDVAETTQAGGGGSDGAMLVTGNDMMSNVISQANPAGLAPLTSSSTPKILTGDALQSAATGWSDAGKAAFAADLALKYPSTPAAAPIVSNLPQTVTLTAPLAYTPLGTTPTTVTLTPVTTLAQADAAYSAPNAPVYVPTVGVVAASNLGIKPPNNDGTDIWISGYGFVGTH